MSNLAHPAALILSYLKESMMTQFAIAFPGQGSQTVGMLAELAEQHAVIKETFAEASQVLGYDLFALVMDGPVTI